ncbi:MAG: hypothetical protein RLP14_07165 [Owenweeksia sp.]|jgi:heme-degrading monooxygenase HmoA
MITHWKTGQAPEAPFKAVIFISVKREVKEDYHKMDELLMNEVQNYEGFLGYSSISKTNQGIFISYWQTDEAIARWRDFNTHREAKSRAPKAWYSYYHSMICTVESSRVFEEMTKAL